MASGWVQDRIDTGSSIPSGFDAGRAQLQQRGNHIKRLQHINLVQEADFTQHTSMDTNVTDEMIIAELTNEHYITPTINMLPHSTATQVRSESDGSTNSKHKLRHDLQRSSTEIINSNPTRVTILRFGKTHIKTHGKPQHELDEFCHVLGHECHSCSVTSKARRHDHPFAGWSSVIYKLENP